MFDEEKSTSSEITTDKQPTEPSFVPAGTTAGKPEDIFAGIEGEEKKIGVPPEMMFRPQKKSSGGKKIVIVIIGLLVIGGLAYGAYWGYEKMQSSKKEQALIPKVEEIIDTKKEIEIKEPILFDDADGDGLKDQEEINLGTNPGVVDTDGDGLADYEEVRIYQTNPLNPDTDADGYLDGQEVRGGYNPKGDGKLSEAVNLNF